MYRTLQHTLLGTEETKGEIKEKSNIIDEIVEKEFTNYFKNNAKKVEVKNLVEEREYYQVKYEEVTYLGAFKGKETKYDIENTYHDSAPEIPVQIYIFSEENVYYSKLPNSLEPVFYELTTNFEKKPDKETDVSKEGGKRRKSRRNRQSKKGKKSRKARKSRRKSNRRR